MPAKLRIPRNGGLVRERLLALMKEVWSCGVSLIVAPAGCGKTTLLAQFATASPLPVAWYRAEPGDGDPDVFLAHLEASARGALPVPAGPWRSAADASLALEQAVEQGLLLVIDDLHALHGSPAERELERLLEYRPDRLAVVAAGRVQPGINVSRLRVSGLLELGTDALRFRTWEVEHLFHDVYAQPLRPEELAELARRTEGWAAGLRLFHLGTQGKTQEQRRLTLRQLGTHSRLVREYLARNVLDGLDAETRGFLLRTSVLGRLNGRLCDRLLQGRGSDAMLAALHRQQLFTDLVDDRGWYRYHAVLRSYLETTAVEEMGEPAVREQRRVAGALLEEEEEFGYALEAYCSAGAWDDAARLLGLRGEELTAGPGQWLDLLPGAMVEVNPWVLLAAARRHLAAGRCRSAVEAYRCAEHAFGDVAGAELCRRERADLTVWLDTAAGSCPGWSGLLRMATRRDPMAVSARAAGGSRPGDLLAAGLAALLSGHVKLAHRMLVEVAAREDSSVVVGVCARLGLVISSALSGEPSTSVHLAGVVEEAERAGLVWLAQLGHAAQALRADASASSGACSAHAEDGWGGALRSLLVGWGDVRRGGGDADRFSRVASTFATLGAPVLELWARGLTALAQGHRDSVDGVATARRVRAAAEALGVPGARALALSVSSDAGERALAAAIVAECGFELPHPLCGRVPAGDESPAPPRPRASAAVTVSCLGPFGIIVADRVVDLTNAKPRVRSLLRLLALHAGRSVHRDVITAALWPEADSDTGRRNLQVAVSALRRLLDTATGPDVAITVLRDGDAYRLELPADAVVDVALVHRLLADGQARRRAGDVDGAIAALGEALGLAAQELLPEEGPAEWLIAPREEHAADLVEAARALATLHADRGEAAAAAAICERGLRVDRYADSIWALLIDAHIRSGNEAAAARARQRYAETLRELGVSLTAC